MKVEEYQELVKKAPELANFFMYMPPGKDGRSAYFREVPRTYRNREARTVPLLKSQLCMAKTSYGLFRQVKGFDEKGMPIVASKVGDVMRGRNFKKTKIELVIEKLRESLVGVAQTV
jgi:hypothetical protein